VVLRSINVKTRSDAAETILYLQFARLFKLRHIALSFERAACGEENILVVLIHVLDPISKPGDCVVVDHLFPSSGCVGFGDRLVLTDVDRNILRTDPFLGTGGSEERYMISDIERP
jgi:hypothetical protein